jgi:hypothetical protein
MNTALLLAALTVPKWEAGIWAIILIVATAWATWKIADIFQHSEDLSRVWFIEKLRDEDGAAVTILCDNDDPETSAENYGIDVWGSFTAWEEKRYYGKTLNEALSKAVMDKIRFERMNRTFNKSR